jgi:hypothetical protein
MIEPGIRYDKQRAGWEGFILGGVVSTLDDDGELDRERSDGSGVEVAGERSHDGLAVMALS